MPSILDGLPAIYRGLLPAFFEKDVPYYAFHRDLRELPGTEDLTDVARLSRSRRARC